MEASSPAPTPCADAVEPRALASTRAPCQRCGSADVSRSRRRVWERPLSWLGVFPYRCLCCLARFYR
jgi:hypothetical protein